MIFKSTRPPVDIPKCHILDYLFSDTTPSDSPLWIDAKDTSHSLSPRQALLWAKRFGFGLQRLGLKHGDVCLLFTPNHIYVPVAYLGAVGLGATFSGANPTFTVKELEYQISNTRAKLLLIHPSLLKVARAAAAKAGLAESQLYLFCDCETPTVDGIKDWRTILGSPEEGEKWHWKKLQPREAQTQVAAINFSSGTTGLPKGVCVSHYNVIANVIQIMSIYTYSSTERWAGFLPLYHAYGQNYAILIATKLHIPMIIMQSFNFEEYLRIIQTHKIQRLQTVPPIMIMLNKRPETSKYDLSSVKEILCGAAPLKNELQHAVSTKFNVRITQGWGMTETTCAATGVPWSEEHLTGSAGMLLPNTEAKIVDDDGAELGVGARGELYVRGPQMALGYWQNLAATKETFGENGWLKTGDVAVFNEKGVIWIVDRKKELIKVQALQVSPAELEASLLEHPLIADVAVVGITIADNEWPRAYVALEESAKGKVSEGQIQGWLKPRVSKHKWLEGGVMFVEEVPKLPSGKIQRKVVKEWARKDAVNIEGVGRARL